MLKVKRGEIVATKTVQCTRCDATESVTLTKKDFEKWLAEFKSWHKRAGKWFCPRCV